MLPRVSIVLLAFVLAGAAFQVASSQPLLNWFHIVSYADESCNKWISYESINIGNGCYESSPGAYTKLDCNSLTAQSCTDNQCTQGCVDVSSGDLARFKTCTATSSSAGIYQKAWCGKLSSPFPGEPQMQRRSYGAANETSNCRNAMKSASGTPVDRCIGSRQEDGNIIYGRGVCKDDVPSLVICTDGTCNSCPFVVPVNTTCSSGSLWACGVGAAESVTASVLTTMLAITVVLFISL